MDAVFEVAVIGVPHAQWGETVKAIYAAKEPISQTQLAIFLEPLLADFKIPKLVQQVDALPRNASGKILKQQLKE